MPLHSNPTYKHPAPSELFLSRTKASDMVWAEQALAMGFNPGLALTKDTSWFVAATRYDKKHGAQIARRLAEETLLPILRSSTKRDAIDAMGELLHGISEAVAHGNLEFLINFAPVFDAMPDNVRITGPRFMGQWVAADQPLPFEHLVWNEVLGQDRKTPGKRSWEWLDQLPWENPLVKVNGAWNDLWGITATVLSQKHQTLSVVEQLADLLPEPLNPRLLDHAFVHGRIMMKRDKTKRETFEMNVLDSVIGLLDRQLSQGSIVLTHGWSNQDMREELLTWSADLAVSAPDMGQRWLNTARRWETAILRHTANVSTGDLPASPPRARL